MQFAYQSGRSCEDAILTLLDKMYSHLERARFGNSVRLLFFFILALLNSIPFIDKQNDENENSCLLLSMDHEIFVRKIPICET